MNLELDLLPTHFNTNSYFFTSSLSGLNSPAFIWTFALDLSKYLSIVVYADSGQVDSIHSPQDMILTLFPYYSSNIPAVSRPVAPVPTTSTDLAFSTYSQIDSSLSHHSSSLFASNE